MHIRSLILASLAASALLAAPAFAAEGPCLTKALNGATLANPICNFNALPIDTNQGPQVTGGPYPVVIYAPDGTPTVVSPGEPGYPGNVPDPVAPPTSVPSTPLTPANPNPGVYSGSLIGTPYEGTPAGQISGFVLDAPFTLPSGVTIPAGTYDGRIAPNGLFVVKAR